MTDDLPPLHPHFHHAVTATPYKVMLFMWMFGVMVLHFRGCYLSILWGNCEVCGVYPVHIYANDMRVKLKHVCLV